ncbi:hypothetical protein G6F57_019391 [Rhizopus arrhizus]|uniref:CCHC-type domain-containing protein n=1 Tax=Rhizopus oryzae TaxID=64495 RepID=A0A9P7BJU6_RHIOR|nr:hypothetical protein G6F30_013834 [Rhizopus arrhizus]KAG0972904.1 hypothetical protein G6F28_013804 [Rhizopus arrhizus]KAG0973294.1 hypothetical protein G6F29_012929 [Rhizopus arrhizus]KAG1001490.1 hypothetical protein G6F27_012825 [Rhizopus arrhizus]KAG1007660.1 hypothetical protein G6F26_013786 [Rhizopus arrhizus]
MRTMNPRLLDNIVASITADSSWRQVADWAINKEDAFNADPRLAEQQLGGAPFASAPANSLLTTGPTPMEIDVISPRRGNYNPPRVASGGRREQQRPYRNPQFNQWASPGVPICGHCGKKGHLSKHCFKANRQPKQQVHLMQGTEGSYVVNQPASGQWNAFGGQTAAEGVAPTVSSAGVNYAVVPESQDFVDTVSSGVGEDVKDAIHSLSYSGSKN